MPAIGQNILFVIQSLCLLLAATVTAGGGQFPGNNATWLIYLKFSFFLLPIITTILLLITGKIKLSIFTDNLCRDKILIFYLALVFISVPLSLSPLFSFQRALYTMFAYTSLFCIFIQYPQIDPQRYQPAGLALISTLSLSVFILTAASPYAGIRYGVQFAGLVHPNMLSSLLAQLFLFVLFVVNHRTIKSVVLLLLLVMIVLLQSRGVWIALSLTVIFIISFDTFVYQSKKSFLVLLFIILAFSGLALSFILSQSLFYDFLSLFTRGGTVDDLLTLTHRTELWSLILRDLTLKELLVGHGYALMAPSVSADFGNGILYGAHNGYLSIMLGSGLFSLFVWLGYWLLQTRNLYKKRSSIPKPALLLSLSSIILLFIHACVAEEFGLHLTPTVIFVFFNIRYALSEKA
jgi:O-antigen ligase